MYSPIISEADYEYARYYKKYGSSSLIRQRMNVLYLRGKGLGPGACAKAADVHPNSVTRWTKTYMERGRAGLLAVSCYRPSSDLVNHADKIKADFDLNPPRCVSQARKRIKQLTGLERGITQVRKFVKHILQFRYRKFRPLPGGKQSIEDLAAQQADFLDQKLNPLLDKAIRGVAEVFFVDAAHPVQGFHNGYVWSQQPTSVRTSSGRQRMNILGAMHATTHELYSISTTDYIKATTVCELITFLRQNLPGKRIHLVLDNARYQRCELVAKAARKYRVHLVFLPPYSPNLNLIERFWKYLKKNVLAGFHYPTKEAFIEAIHSFIDEVNEGVHNNELSQLINLKFQRLDGA
jgi:transposase